MVIHLGAPLPTPSSNQPGSTDGPSLTLPYLVLLLVGFTWHPASPSDPVSSYLTLSPLPPFRRSLSYGGPCRQGCGGRTSLCGTFPGVTPAGRYPAPCPVEPGLSSLRLRQRLGGRRPSGLLRPKQKAKTRSRFYVLCSTLNLLPRLRDIGCRRRNQQHLTT